MEIKKEILPTALPRRVFLYWSCVLAEGLGKGFWFWRHLLRKDPGQGVSRAHPPFSELTFPSFTALFMDHNESFRLPSPNRCPIPGSGRDFYEAMPLSEQGLLIWAY